MTTPADDPLIQLTVYIPESLRKRLRMTALTVDSTATALAREAIVQKLDEIDGERT